MSKPRFNPLAPAVLALVFERPMYPYEIATTPKQRQKHESIKLRYGTLYTAIDLLVLRGLIRPQETSRGGRWPAPLLGQKFPAIFFVESQYRLALLKAEFEFADELVRNITEQGWGSLELWCNMQTRWQREYRRENEHAAPDIAQLGGTAARTG